MSEGSYYPLILNGDALVSGSNGNSVYRYTFPVGSVKFKNSKVAIANISLYYSWFNVSVLNNNNSYSFDWPTPAGTTPFTITMPDGYYDVSGLNQYLQQFCITNNLYLINTGGDYVYYLEFVSSGTYYAIQFNSYPVPTALPAGWTAPAGWLGYPLLAAVPRLTVPATNFRNLIGFNAQTTPVSAVAYSKLSDFTPQITPVQSVIVSCSLLNNKYANPTSVLYTFAFANTQYGSIISVEPTQFSFIDVQDGNYPYFDVQFLDQDFNPLQIRDTNLVIQLLIKTEVKGISY
jgi:hypothetical protein